MINLKRKLTYAVIAGVMLGSSIGSAVLASGPRVL